MRGEAAGLVYDRDGCGESLVLLHGIGSRRGVFEPVTQVLRTQFDVIAVDLAGFGESPERAVPVRTISDFADDVAAMLADLGLEHAHLVGSSMGGGIALELARRGVASSVTAFAPIGMWRRPGLEWTRLLILAMRVMARALAPVAPALSRSRLVRKALVSASYGRPGQVDADRFLADAEALAGARGMAAALRAFARYTPPGPAELAGAPVTIVWGVRDAVLPCATQSRRAEHLLTSAQVRRLPGCGHLPFLDDPAACIDAILATTTRAGRSSTTGTTT